jgi:hypothetical protein
MTLVDNLCGKLPGELLCEDMQFHKVNSYA